MAIKRTNLGSGSGSVPTTRTITAGTGLTGGGDLSANRTLAVTNPTVTLTQAAYDALTKDPNTLYVVIG